MGLEMVLNVLSLYPQAKDIQAARQRMSDLTGTLLAARKAGVSRVLRTDRDFNSEELAPGYPVARWRNDREVDQVERSYFRTLETKAPYLGDIVNSEIKAVVEDSDGFYGSNKAEGLKVAYFLDFLAISLRSAPHWDHGHIELKISQLDDSGEINEELALVTHANCKDHVVEHDGWIKSHTRLEIFDGSDLWTRKEELFPHLIFCDAVGGQLQQVLHGEPLFHQIVRRLQHLEDYCCNWSDDSFDHTNIVGKVSPESDLTLKTYRKDHAFRCPDGTERLFSWHSRLTPGKWRIYFCPLEQERIIIVGYIGPHLPTVSFRS